jgi:hypothetical protein
MSECTTMVEGIAMALDKEGSRVMEVRPRRKEMATTLYNKEGGGVAAAAHQGGRRSGQGADGEFEQGAVERSRSGQRCKWRGEAPRGKEVEVACGARDAGCLFQLFLIFY